VTVLDGRDLAGETLPYGINPEEMVLDLARKLDEDRRDTAAAFEASFAEAPTDDAALEELPLDEEPLPGLPLEDAAPLTPAGPVVLLVDDEPDIRGVVGERLAKAGFDVRPAGSVAGARTEMARLAAAGAPFLLVVDLGLPTESGSSFRGGLDVARAASALPDPPPVLLMAEGFDDRIRARAKRIGVPVLAFKPGLSKLDPLQYQADLRAFGDKLSRDLLPRLGSRRPGAAAGPKEALPAAPGSGGEAREVVLRAALEDMRRNPDPDLVAFLLLRAARAFFPRVLLFVVKDEHLRGLSGFGPSDSGDSLDLLAREIKVPLDPPSPFSEAVANGRAWSGTLPPEGPVRELLDRIGSMGASDAAILPVTAHRETIAVLYGDAPEATALPPMEPLVKFAEQAGRAIDEAFVSRRTPVAAAC
jgi:CheY-like chemotaxis protein